MLLILVLGVYAVGWLVAGAVIAAWYSREERRPVSADGALLGVILGFLWPLLLPIALAGLAIFVLARQLQRAD